MRIQVLLSLALSGILICSGSAVFAQQTDASGSDATDQAKASGDDDLKELAGELEATDEKDEKAATKRVTAAKSAMNSYASRARKQAIEARTRLTKNPQWQPTHKQVNRIEIGAKLNNMCLDSHGHILACCGDKIIRVLTQEGKLLETRKLTFTPEAIAVRASDGAIFIGGQGQLIRTNADGELEEKCVFPAPPTEAEKEVVVQKMLKRHKAQAKQRESMVAGIKKQLDTITEQFAKEELSDDEQAKIAAVSQAELFARLSGTKMVDGKLQVSFKKETPLAVQVRVLEAYIKLVGGTPQMSADVELQIRRRAKRQTGTARYTGLAVADDDLFVICSGAGYSYNAWRMNHDFGQPKRILTGLSGCCGQMDCQTHDGNLWLAMNTQHKAICYDRDGTKLSEFGKRDAAAADGFGGCCEPKNLRFSKDGKYVYCAQSGPPVCVKRFTLDGTFKDIVCFPVFETGCVRVSVDVDGETFFMMSPNESTIYVFAPAQS